MEDLPVEKSIVGFGCARYNNPNVDLLFDVVKNLFHRCLAVRSGGSAALDLAKIAAGNHGAYIELLLQPYDYAAASVILEEAGGIITRIGGGEISLTEPCSILAGTKKAHKEVMKIAKEKGYSSDF
jgi:myo-inositol-1(or 4)-monophosphatase